MSYAPLRSFGGIEPWDRAAAETDEVYLWRAAFLGADIKSIQDMQAIAGAIGKNQNLGLDLRGIAVKLGGSGHTYDVDAAFTTKLPRAFWLDPTIDNAADIGKKVQVVLLQRFPSLQIQGARFDQITDAVPTHPALDFWLSHAVIYNAEFLGGMVPTQAFARFEGLYRGSADQGLKLKKWPKDQPPPPNGGNGNGVNGGADESIVPLVLLGAGAAFAAYLIYQRTSRQGAAT